MGLVMALVPLRYIDTAHYDKSIMGREAVFKDNLVKSYMDITVFRDRYPVYVDMDGEELARRLHARYFNEMEFEAYRTIFLTSPSDGQENNAPRPDPLFIRGEVESISPKDTAAQAVYSIDALNFELAEIKKERIAFPYVYALMLGGALVLVGLALAVSRRKKNQ